MTEPLGFMLLGAAGLGFALGLSLASALLLRQAAPGLALAAQSARQPPQGQGEPCALCRAPLLLGNEHEPSCPRRIAAEALAQPRLPRDPLKCDGRPGCPNKPSTLRGFRDGGSQRLCEACAADPSLIPSKQRLEASP